MMKRRKQGYYCLILFQEDIKDLVQLFQNNLQDVEIVIDDLLILDIEQLEQFDETYQAKSIRARGYGYESVAKDTPHQRDHLLIELTINHKRAILSLGKEVSQADPDILRHIRNWLERCVNNIHLYLTTSMIFTLFMLPWLTLFNLLEESYHTYSIAQNILFVLSGILLIPATYFLFTFIVSLLKRETMVFLLIGRRRTTHAYGWRESVIRLIIAIVLAIVFEGGIIIALRFWL